MLKGKKIVIILILIGTVLFAVSYFLTNFYSVYGNTIVKANVSGKVFQAEKVSSSDRLAKGLSKRRNLCVSCAMLFEFQKPGKYSFWMKDMEIDLDIIWILKGTIVHIEKNVQADFKGVLKPQTDADAVLEINAGKADELGIKVGDVIAF